MAGTKEQVSPKSKDNQEAIKKVKSDEADNTKMRAFFSFGSVLAFVQYLLNALKPIALPFKTLVNGIVTVVAGIWNIFDGIFSIKEGIQALRRLWRAKRHIKEKIAFALNDILTGTHLIATGVLLSLVIVGAIFGISALVTLAVVAVPAAAASFALACMAALTKTAVQYYRANRKTDPMYLLRDRMHKLNNLEAKIERLKERNKTPELLEKLEAHRKDLVNEANALYAVHVQNPAIENLEKDYPRLNEWLKVAHDEQQIIAEKAIAKQIEKRTRLKASLVAWGFATVGMSLAFAAIFFPPLLIPAIALNLVATGVKLYEIHRIHKLDTGFPEVELNPLKVEPDPDFMKQIESQKDLRERLEKQKVADPAVKQYEQKFNKVSGKDDADTKKDAPRNETADQKPETPTRTTSTH